MVSPAGFIGAGIFQIRNRITIRIGASFGQRRTWLIRAEIIPIEDPITVAVTLTDPWTAV